MIFSPMDLSNIDSVFAQGNTLGQEADGDEAFEKE
jgi:hypothetical protein